MVVLVDCSEWVLLFVVGVFFFVKMVVVSSTFNAPVEGVLLQSPSTKLLVNDQELGTATLYITEQ